MENHREKIIDIIDPESGLLDKLLKIKALTHREFAEIKDEATIFKKNETLLKYIFQNDKQQDLLTCLLESNQKHVVNWVEGNGEYRDNFGLDWPLTEKQNEILNDNQEMLSDILETRYLVNLLYSKEVISSRQRELIESRPASHKRNEALLDIVRRLSQRSFLIIEDCLRDSNQSHIVEILEGSGAVVRVHSSLESNFNLNEVEALIVDQMANVLCPNTTSIEQANRLIDALQLKVIAAKLGQSIVLYIWCSEEKEFHHLCKIINDSEMKNILEKLFNLLVDKMTVRILTVHILEKDLTMATKTFQKKEILTAYGTYRDTKGHRTGASMQTYRSDQFTAILYHYDSKSDLLALSNYMNVPSYSNATLIQLSIVNEDVRMEWTLTAQSLSLSVLRNRPIELVLPQASSSHRIVVTMKLLLEILNNDREATNKISYEVQNEVSCTASNVALHASADRLLTCHPFKDFRPRIRENVGFGGSDGNLIVLAKSDSVLPENISRKYNFKAARNPFLFYEGQNKDMTCSRLLFKVPLTFSGSGTMTEFTVKFFVSEDGSLTATIRENEYDITGNDYSPQIVDVLGRKIPTDENEPNLSVQLNRSFGDDINQTVIEINTTYHTNEIQRWRISFTPSSKTFGIGKKSYIFLIPVSGFEQSFRVPAELLENGVKYDIRVEGLQLLDSTSAQDSAFKVVCSKSTTLTLNAPEPTRVTQKETRLKIRIERDTFHQATVVLSYDNAYFLKNIRWKITISKAATTTGPIYYSISREFIVRATSTEQRYDLPLQLQPGHSYKVEVDALGLTIPKETTSFRAELTLNDITILHARAKAHAVGHGSSTCRFLYRNKSQEYFNDILIHKGGIMEVYDKDNSGDPASPINLQVKGLFFTATVEQGTHGEPMRHSAFGPVRICIPAEELLGMAPNLYFVDYYCMRGKAHYVTIVMAKPGSEADQYCQPRLMKLDINDHHNNPFFFRDTLGQLKVSSAFYMQVELLFTEKLDIREYALTSTPIVGRGSSAPGGIRKNPDCGKCNMLDCSEFEIF